MIAMLIYILLALAVVAVVAWEFVPQLRERMRGWTTIATSAVVAAVPLAGEVLDVLQDTQWREFIPEGAWKWALAAFAGWAIIKRIQTRSPVGRKF